MTVHSQQAGRRSSGQHKQEELPPAMTCRKATVSVLTLFGRSLRMCLLSIVYVPFVFAVLVQSCVLRKPLDPKDHKEEMRGWAWIAGLLLFFSLLALACLPAEWRPPSMDYYIVLYVFLGALFVVHAATAFYASQRQGTARDSFASGFTKLIVITVFCGFRSPINPAKHVHQGENFLQDTGVFLIDELAQHAGSCECCA